MRYCFTPIPKCVKALRHTSGLTPACCEAWFYLLPLTRPDSLLQRVTYSVGILVEVEDPGPVVEAWLAAFRAGSPFHNPTNGREDIQMEVVAGEEVVEMEEPDETRRQRSGVFLTVPMSHEVWERPRDTCRTRGWRYSWGYLQVRGCIPCLSPNRTWRNWLSSVFDRGFASVLPWGTSRRRARGWWSSSATLGRVPPPFVRAGVTWWRWSRRAFRRSWRWRGATACGANSGNQQGRCHE